MVVYLSKYEYITVADPNATQEEVLGLLTEEQLLIAQLFAD